MVGVAVMAGTVVPIVSCLIDGTCVALTVCGLLDATVGSAVAVVTLLTNWSGWFCFEPKTTAVAKSLPPPIQQNNKIICE